MRRRHGLPSGWVVVVREREEALISGIGGFDGPRVTPEYASAIGRAAYLWGWPLVNLHNRRGTAVETDGVVTQLFEFRNIGLPAPHHWTTQRNGAAFGTDYLSRTAIGKSNIFVNTANETAYYYQDLDESGQRLHGANTYTVRFPSGELPPVQGFWSLTVYNKHHFFHPNDLDRYSLGTKNQDLNYSGDGSLTLTVGGPAPTEAELLSNWLPAPDDEFSIYLRAYWPDRTILDGTWQPPSVANGCRRPLPRAGSTFAVHGDGREDGVSPTSSSPIRECG